MKHTTTDFFNALYGDNKITFRYMAQDQSKNFSLHQKHDQIMLDMQNKTLDAYFLVNPTQSTSTKDADVKHFTAAFIDIDDSALPNYFPVDPSAIVSREDEKGHHVYWFLNPTDLKDEWETVQKLLIKYYNSDKVIKNPARRIRIPGTINQKEKRNGQRYLIKELNNNKYDLYDITIAHTDIKKLKEKARKEWKNYLQKNPVNLESENKRQQVNDFLIKTAMRMHGLGLDEESIYEELKYINKKHFKEEFNEESLRRCVKAKKYAKNKKGAEGHQEIEKEIKRQERVKEVLENWYYVQKGNFFINYTDVEIERNKEGFNAEFAHFADIQNFAGYVFVNDLIKQAEQLKYEPGKDKILPGALNYINLNMWKDDAIKEDDTDYQWFLDHIEFLITDKAEREHFLNFLAYIIQNPGAKVRHAVVIIGGQGIGKSIMNTLFEKLLGPSNVTKPQNEHMAENYTRWARNASLCIINELFQADKWHFYNRIKPFITDDTIHIREMFKDVYEIENHMNFICYTNHEVPVKLEHDDRRWMFIKSDAVQKDPEYYAEFYSNCITKAGGVKKYLLEKDTTGFCPNSIPLMTEAKQHILNDSKSEIELWISERIQHKAHPFDNDMVCISDIMNELPDKYRYDKTITSKYLAKILKIYGGKPLNTAVRIEGEPKKFFIIREHLHYFSMIEKEGAKQTYLKSCEKTANSNTEYSSEDSVF